MSPCSPNDVSLTLPSGPSGPAIPGFGIPSVLSLPNISPFPDGFPEDLLDILNKLQLLVPPGALKPQLNPNFGKDVFDGIMKLLDQFMPFLMLYKFFLPVLNLIICIIEVLCSLMNPFALISALIRLFRNCIPEFLNLFPVFAMIIMIISLLLLLLALIEYLIQQILKLIKALLRNIQALQKAFQNGDANGVLAVAKKIGSLLCMFQNLFVLLAIFAIIIDIIKNILKLVFAIPPCGSGNSGDTGCCVPETCPAIVKNQYTRTTGSFKYFSQVGIQTSVVLPPPFGNFNFNIRNEAWQLFDADQEATQKFRNIFDAVDILTSPKPIFFPTDAVYTSQTDPKQAPYLLDLRLFYNPGSWGRLGQPRFIKFNDCIMFKVPPTKISEGDNTTQNFNNGVAFLVGGKGFEDDGTTVLTGFDVDGVTPISDQATLENFIHQPTINSSSPVLSVNDGYVFEQMEYTFKPNIAPLFQKNLVTLGCIPEIALNREFITNVFAGDVGLKTAQLGSVVFPDPAGAQECLAAAVATLRSNITVDGVAQFQATTNICLQKLKDDTNSALHDTIGVGFDPCKSSFTLAPPVQFTSKPIIVSVSLNERNGLSLTTGLSPDVAADLAAKVKAHITFGDVGNFNYDGYQFFTAQLTSDIAGKGQVMISFDNNTFCTNNIPTDITISPTHDLQVQDYQFIYAPSPSTTSEGDTDGKPRRDEGDLSRDSIGGGTKDGV